MNRKENKIEKLDSRYGRDNTSCVTPQDKRRRPKLALTVILWFVGLFVVGMFLLVVPVLVKGADREALIRIPRHATLKNVEDSLRLHLGEDYSDKVIRLMKIRNVDWKLRHGSYKVSEGDTPIETLRRLSSGAQEPVKLTLNGFRSVDELCNRIAARLDFSADSLRKLLADKEFMKVYDLTPDQALGLFLNDTYEVYWSSSPRSVLTKIGKNYLRYWSYNNQVLASGLGLTPAQAMTLASIVDEETNALDEKGKVGRLYINRLQKGMRLQSDPTVRYALNDFTIKRVTGKHLQVDSPYNTYKVNGLPPGPIRTTSVSTLNAILNSEPSDYIYMCARPDFSGRHNFSATYEEHLKNAKEYQQELDRRGIQ